MTMTITAQNLGLVNRANQTDPLPGLGTQVNQCKNVMKCVYNFAVLGGATGSIGLLDDQGNSAFLPQGAVISRVAAYVNVAPLSTGSATVALKLLTTADLMTAIAKASLTLSSTFTGVPLDGAASATATFVGPVTAAGGTQVSAVIATAPLSAGKITYFLEWYDTN